MRNLLQSRPKESYTEVRPIWSQFDFGLVVLEGQVLGVRRLQGLSELGIGESALLVALDLPPGVQNHLMYMGFVPDARVKVLHRAPAGDPTVYSVDGIEIALRRETAKSILVRRSSVLHRDEAEAALDGGGVSLEETGQDSGELLEAAR